MNFGVCCYPEPINRLPSGIFGEVDADSYVDKILSSVVTREALDGDYHRRVTTVLKEAIIREIGDPTDAALFEETRQLSDNLIKSANRFVAHKQYQQVKLFEKLRGEITDLDAFKAEGRKLFSQFNETFLEAEYDTVISASQSAFNYAQQLEIAQDFPLLEYRTLRDNRVRPEHVALDGIVLPVNHSFWRRYTPPNGWNCRCFTVSVVDDDRQITELTEDLIKQVRDETPEVFRNNPALTGKLFADSHPYFDVTRQERTLSKRNFNLPNI